MVASLSPVADQVFRGDRLHIGRAHIVMTEEPRQPVHLSLYIGRVRKSHGTTVSNYGLAITEVDSPHLRGGCRLVAKLHLFWARGSSDLIAWESAWNGSGNLAAKWESGEVSPGLAFGWASLQRDLTASTDPSLIAARTKNPLVSLG